VERNDGDCEHGPKLPDAGSGYKVCLFVQPVSAEFIIKMISGEFIPGWDFDAVTCSSALFRLGRRVTVGVRELPFAYDLDHVIVTRSGEFPPKSFCCGYFSHRSRKPNCSRDHLHFDNVVCRFSNYTFRTPILIVIEGFASLKEDRSMINLVVRLPYNCFALTFLLCIPSWGRRDCEGSVTIEVKLVAGMNAFSLECPDSKLVTQKISTPIYQSHVCLTRALGVFLILKTGAWVKSLPTYKVDMGVDLARIGVSNDPSLLTPEQGCGYLDSSHVRSLAYVRNLYEPAYVGRT